MTRVALEVKMFVGDRGQRHTPRSVSPLLDLAFPPPKLVEAILEGTQPADMTAETLTRREWGLVWEMS